eukprot:1303137-Rhodomonas_salina.1
MPLSLVLLENADPYAETWVTSLSVGPTVEEAVLGQQLSFDVQFVSGDLDLFAAAPLISSAGELTLTLAQYKNGHALFAVAAVDDGGTLRGGQNRSTTLNLTITVLKVNQRPTFQLPEPVEIYSGSVTDAVDAVSFTVSPPYPPGTDDWRGDEVDGGMVGKAISVVLHPAEAPLLKETRVVSAYNETTGVVVMDSPFASVRVSGSVAHADANGLYYPVAQSVSGSLAWKHYSQPTFLFFRSRIATALGPCAGSFWVVDSAPTYDRAHGAVRHLLVTSSGRGYIPGEL